LKGLLHRKHRRLHAGVPRHHNDDRFGTTAFDFFQNLQAAKARQAQIQQHHVDAGGVQHAESVLRVICNVGRIAYALSDVAAALTDGPLIVNDEQVQQICLRFVAIWFHG
jgi:hypothetical protein